MEEIEIIINPVGNNKTTYTGIQEEFKDKTFCVVGEEMKVKMKVLGLTENDIAEISFENKNQEYLELVDIYFPQVQELKGIIREKYLEENSKYRNYDDFQDMDFQEMVNEETKRSLLGKLSYNISLKELFRNYDGIWQKVINKRYFRNFSHLVRYAQIGKKYKFDPILAIQFFELAEKIERNIKGGENRYDVFDGICDAYENMYKIVPKDELFNDILKLCIASGEKNLKSLIYELVNFNNRDDKDLLIQNYDDIIKLGILSGEDNNAIFRYDFINRYLKILNGENKDLIMSGFEKLGKDFLEIISIRKGIIENIIEIFPDKYIEFCENIKKIADLTGGNYKFYILCFKEVSDFVILYQNSWEFLYKTAKILGKYSSNTMGTGIKFLKILYTKNPNNFEEILGNILEISKEMKDKNKILFFSSGLDFLAPYLEKEGENTFLKMAEKMVNFSNIYLTEENNGIFYFKKENPLTYGIGFINIYIKYFPNKYDEIIERITKLINKSGKDREKKFEMFLLGINDFIKEVHFDKNPVIIDKILDFYEKIIKNDEDIKLIFNLVSTNFDATDKKNISNALTWLLNNDQDKIMNFIKSLFIISYLNLNINLNNIFKQGIEEDNFKNIEDEINTGLMYKKSFEDDNGEIKYYDIIQKVFGERIYKKMNKFEKISEIERNRNILKINEKQKNSLKNYGIMNLNDFNDKHRTLVLYYRDENMNKFQFGLITHILYKFIEGGYSKVFDKILISSRGEGEYPKEIHNLGDIKYQYSDFKNITNIFANTIHFTHGTVIEKDFMNTTTHIIGIANLADNNNNSDRIRIPENGNYIPLYLKYGITHGTYNEEHLKMDKSGEFNTLFEEIIRSVKACEEKMILSITNK